jgi:hypothetical protein
MAKVSRQFPEGNQHKPPFAQPSVGNGQHGGAENDILIKQNVNVNFSRAFGDAGAAAQCAFD